MPKPTAESKALEPAVPQPADLFREFDHAMHEMERRMDRLMRDSFGKDGLRFPLVQGLLLQPGADGRLTIQPFGHLQESLDRLAEGIREPALSWTLSGDGKSVEFRAEVPGLKKGDLDVQVHPEYISIEGKSQDKAKNTRYSARCQPGFKLKTDDIDAHCEDGVLTIRCKVAESPGNNTRRVNIR